MGDTSNCSIVMAATEFKVVYFPFKDGDDHLVNAVLVEPFQLWVDSAMTTLVFQVIHYYSFNFTS